jgi:tetratricopeptide (TPR) repeat protein
MKNKSLLSILLLSSVLSASSLNEAKDLFAEQKYQEAYTLLESLWQQNMADEQINYYLGRSAFELHEYDSALSAFERVLIVDEGHMRTRLELGRVYLALGRDDDAKKEFARVLASNPPENVQKNVQAILDGIKEKHSSLATFFLSASLGYDTNINNVPTIDIMTDYLVSTYNLDPTGVNADDEQDSGYLQAVFYGQNLYGLKDNLYLKGSFLGYSQSFFEDSSENVLYGKASLGVDYLHKSTNYALNGYYEKLFLDADDYMYGIGIAPNLTYKIDGSNTAFAGLVFGKKYFDDATKDARFVEGSIGYQKRWDTNTIRFDFARKSESSASSAPQAYIDFDQNSLRFSYMKSFVGLFDLSSSYNYKMIDYDDNIIGAAIQREDKQHKVDLKLTKKISDLFTVALEYGYTKRNSNYVPMQYDKHFVSIGLTTRF